MKERSRPSPSKVEAADDGGVILRFQVGLSTELVRWVLSFGPEVRVLAPEPLATEVQRQHLEAAQGQPRIEGAPGADA